MARPFKVMGALLIEAPAVPVMRPEKVPVPEEREPTVAAPEALIVVAPEIAPVLVIPPLLLFRPPVIEAPPEVTVKAPPRVVVPETTERFPDATLIPLAVRAPVEETESFELPLVCRSRRLPVNPEAALSPR
jgi:hypothetical protein